MATLPLPGGETAFALALERLHPDRQVDQDVVTRDAVALLTAIEGHTDLRFVLQTIARPHPERGRGRLDISLLVILEPRADETSAAARIDDLLDDLLDMLSAPPLRWIFAPVTSEAELRQLLNPAGAESVAEVLRRETHCGPAEWKATGGFGGEPGRERVVSGLWSLWTFGQAAVDQRRVASVLLAQEAPVVSRILLRSARLAAAERSLLEDLLLDAEARLGGRDGLARSSLRTLEAFLYLRPLFEVRCLVASPEPLSRSMLSALGHAVSEPAEHVENQKILRGGFAVGRSAARDSDLRDAFAGLSLGSSDPGLAPAGLERLRRLFGVWEAANLFRIPVSDGMDFPGLQTSPIPDLAAPVARLSLSGPRLGRTADHPPADVRLAAEDRLRHLYVVGQTGSGKSTLLMNLALQDISRGGGVAVLDPHGDLVEALLERIPDERASDVVLIDPADPVAVVGVNLLEAETPVQAEYIVEELSRMFYALFDPRKTGIVGPRFETMLRQAAHLLMAQNEVPASFLDIGTLFVDDAVRNHLSSKITDPVLAEFWLGEMQMRRSNEWQEVVSWFRSKFEVFRTSHLVRNVLGQSTSSISFSEILRDERILLVNLSKGLLGEYNSALIGHIVFARLWGAALERASMPSARRSDFHIYIDEFQNITNESLPDVLSEARKFHVGLTLANQFFTQIPEETRDAIMGNVGSRVTFRLGPKDAALFSSWVGEVDAEDLTQLPNYTAVASLGSAGVPLPPFVLQTETPAESLGADRAMSMRDESRKRWARPVADLDSTFFSRWSGVPGSISARLSGQAVGGQQDAGLLTTRSTFLDEWLRKREARHAEPAVAGDDDSKNCQGMEPADID